MVKLTIVLVVISALVAVVVAFKESNEDWKELHDKIYRSEVAISPEEVHEILTKLQQLYTDRSDEGSVKRLRRVNNLLKVAEVSESRCSDQKAMQFAYALIRYFKASGDNVVHYIKHYFKKQIDTCRTFIEREIEAAKKDLGQDTFERLQRLSRYISEDLTTPDSPALDPKLYKQLSGFLQAEKKIAHPKTWTLRKLTAGLDDDMYFKDLVKKPCDAFKISFQKLFFLSLYDKDILDSLDPEVIDMTKKVARISRFIAKDSEFPSYYGL